MYIFCIAFFAMGILYSLMGYKFFFFTANPHHIIIKLTNYMDNMRLRYWRLGITDVLEAKYPVEKANHWEIKCMQGEYQHFGVFWYRYGTPFDKEPIHGICFYYNEIPEESIQMLKDFLSNKFGGTPIRRKTRVFLQGSQEFSDPKSIGILAKEISTKFSGPTE